MRGTIQHLREWLTLLLLGLLPFHAFLVTVGTKLIAGPGHAPMTALALWKEAMLGLILVLSCVEIFWAMGKVRSEQWKALRLDAIDWLIVALVVLGIGLSLVLRVPRGAIALGIRYDFVPLAAFLILRHVPWSERFQRLFVRLILVVGGVVALLGVASFFFPVSFFVKLGYANLHSLYVPDQPLAPFQQIGESWVRRIQGTMSGPNQLGIWLLLPSGVLLALLVSERGIRGIRAVLGAVLLLALFLTFSRAAWIAAFVLIILTLWKALPRRMFRRLTLWAGAAVIVAGVAASAAAPQVFFRLSSSRGHFVRPLQAIAMMARHPLGLGLGSSGPASNRTSEPCVFLRPQDDPSWAKSQPTLCVFLGTTQVQPTDHFCACPFLPENWYLQIGVELGVAGFVLFIALTVAVLRRLARGNGLSLFFLFFLGVSIAALFLHAWEDAAVAYTGWVMAAVALSQRQREG